MVERYFPYTTRNFKTQEGFSAWRDLVDRIMEAYRDDLPSIYQSTVLGPNNSLDFLAIAEQLAKIQIAAQNVFHDSQIDFTRPQFLYQIHSILAFPQGSPRFDSDEQFRRFLKNFIPLLTENQILQQALQLIFENITVVETGKHDFQVLVEGFPPDPFLTKENVDLVLDIIKPAHTVYQYAHLFRESLDPIQDTLNSQKITLRLYEDARIYCKGLAYLRGTQGETLSNTVYFRDVTRSFSSVVPSVAELTVETGTNVGVYEVEDVLTFFQSTDANEVAYTTSPTGLSGTLTIENNIVTDTAQNWALVEEGEILTISEGVNAGSYRVNLLIPSGEIAGIGSTNSQKISISPSILQLKNPMQFTATGQTYKILLDLKGKKEPIQVLAEDASSFFVP